MKYVVSEIFKSIEGEGPYSGTPTVYIRFAGCNLTCKAFNNPDNLDTTNENLGFNPKDCKSLHDLPIIKFGCDSLYSHDKRFNHLWEKLSLDELVDKAAKLVNYNWVHPVSNLPVILSFTGGEPTLQSKKIIDIINHPLMKTLEIILIETNGSVPLTDEFIFELDKWVWINPLNRKVIWSNSPKLSNSGELASVAIRPDVVIKQCQDQYNQHGEFEQYFKFVCGSNAADFDEVHLVMKQYHEAGISESVPVYIMPEACLEEQQINIAAKVAQLCIDRGYIYCHRIQNSVFGNTVGT